MTTAAPDDTVRSPVAARVLLLEDSDIDAELLMRHLSHSPVALQVTRVARRREFEATLAQPRFDLVLADYSLPDFDGLDALRMARRHWPDVPFVFVSGVVGEDVATESLRHGATDYVLKRSLSRLTNAVERALAEASERAQRRQAEAALGASEANTRLAIEAAHLGMWHYAHDAPDGRQFGGDSRCQQMCGLDGRASVSYADFLARVHSDERKPLDDAFRTTLAQGPGGRLFHEGRTLDAAGSERWIVMRGELMVDPARGDLRLLGVMQDVTAQKLAEARQRRIEMMFRMAAEAADIGVWELDIARDAWWFDDGVRRMADLPPGDEPSLQTMLDRAIHPDDRQLTITRLAAAARPESGPDIEFELRMIGHGNGRLRWVAIKGRRVGGADGRPRLIGTARDITEQKRQDQALRFANETLEERVALRTRERDRIWNLSPDLMAVCRPEGWLAAVNPAWEALPGWPAEALLEANLLDVIDNADVDATRAHLRSLGESQVAVRFDNRLRRRGGGHLWIRWTASADSGLVYVIGRDVTAERQAADELAAANRELTAQIAERGRVETTLRQMQRLEAVGQLTAGVAHDFNNLLTVVLSNINLIRRLLQPGRKDAPVADPRVLQRLDSMRSAAERGATLTAQLLAFSRRQRLEPQAVDLNDTVLGMRDLLQTTMGGSVQLHTELAETLWPALVDPTQLELIILNLAINARDAMEVGGSLTLGTVNLRLDASPRRPEEPEPGEYVALRVTDTGSGMSAEVLAKAFEPFFTTKEVGRGSGLGLAQVYGFAKQSGGGVRIDTRAGEGTTVHVFIPRARDLTPVVKLSPEPAAPAEAPSGARHTLLVVDDDPAVREATSSTLDMMGYRVLQAPGGAAAIELLATRRDVALVIADFAMPGMNGAELARRLRATHPALRVLFYTGFVDLAVLKDVPEEHVLQKPLRGDELGERVRRLLTPSVN